MLCITRIISCLRLLIIIMIIIIIIIIIKVLPPDLRGSEAKASRAPEES